VCEIALEYSSGRRVDPVAPLENDPYKLIARRLLTARAAMPDYEAREMALQTRRTVAIAFRHVRTGIFWPTAASGPSQRRC
jgi:hypothetical protein